MKIFIASSTIGLTIAQAIQVNLEQYAEVVVWNQQVFEISSYPLEALEQTAKSADYGVFVMTPDDIRKSGRRVSPTPRDNVILELGVFLGSLGRRRSFLVVPSDVPNLLLPTDLMGLVQARYKSERIEENPTAALGAACTKIRQAIEKLNTSVEGSESTKDQSPTTLSRESESKAREADTVGSLLHHYGRLPPGYTGHFLRGAHEEICILGFSLRSFIGYFDSRPEVEFKVPILEALGRGAQVSFLFLDPESAAAKVFARERQDKRLLGDIRRSIGRAVELKSEFASTVKRPKMEIRTYACLPFAHIKRIDNGTDSARLMCLPYLPGLKRADTPYLEVRRRSNPFLFQAYSRALDNILSMSQRLE
jgi:hypothetical protein